MHKRTQRQEELVFSINAIPRATILAFHDTILGVKDQVIAQYGPNSDEVASLGLKKKSERKAPVHASKPAA